MEATPAKPCSRCQIAKPLADFGRDRSRADGYAHRCRACAVEVNRGAYERQRVAAGKPAGPVRPRPPAAAPGHKVCRVCGELHPAWHFHNDKSRADGLSSRGRRCEAARSAARYAAAERSDRKAPAPATARKARTAATAPPRMAAPQSPEAAAKLAAKAAERAARAAELEAAAAVILAAAAERARAEEAAWKARLAERAASTVPDGRVAALLAKAAADAVQMRAEAAARGAALPAAAGYPAG